MESFLTIISSCFLHLAGGFCLLLFFVVVVFLNIFFIIIALLTPLTMVFVTCGVLFICSFQCFFRKTRLLKS